MWSDGRMKLYAETPGRRLGQALADLLLVLWLVGWTWVGTVVHDATLELAAPGEQLTASATGLSGAMQDAGGTLDDVPVIGEEVRAPFDEASGAADRLAEVGQEQVRAVERLALWLGLSVAAIPILLGCLLHLPRRVRFARRASAGARFVDAGEDLDLFALRALAHQPLHVLARISDDPAGAWRRGDRDVTDRLAGLELRASGLRPPAAAARR
jgi:hypothetical protein